MRHRDVAQCKAAKVLRAQGYQAEDVPGYARRLLQDRQPCSCLLCGNRRRYLGKTRQEIIADEDMAEQLRELVT